MPAPITIRRRISTGCGRIAWPVPGPKRWRGQCSALRGWNAPQTPLRLAPHTDGMNIRLFLGGRSPPRPSHRVGGWGNPDCPSPCGAGAWGNPDCPSPCGAGAWGNPVSPHPCSSSLCSPQVPYHSLVVQAMVRRNSYVTFADTLGVVTTREMREPV